MSGLHRLAVGIDHTGLPVVALPVDQVIRRIVADAFPPDIAVIGERDVGEDGVLRAGRIYAVLP